METALEVRPSLGKEAAIGRAEGSVAGRENREGNGPELGTIVCLRNRKKAGGAVAWQESGGGRRG